MYWNILVWLRIEIPDGFLHQISENLKIDDLVTGGTINLQLTRRELPSSHPLLQDKYNTQASSPASHCAVRTLYQLCRAFSSEQ